MLTPVSVLFELAGSPQQDGCMPVAESSCRVCGAQGIARGIVYGRWQGGNFTDQNKLRDWGAQHVCESCVWAHAWVSPPGWSPSADDIAKKAAKRAAMAAEAAKAGKVLGEERPPNLRLYSHFWCAGEYNAWNKANKPQIRDWLRAPKAGPWFAAIADTGQKHVLPWTPLNLSPRGARVRFEEQNITLGDFAVVDAMTAALTAGVTKEEIERGEYGVRAWTIARRHVESFESDHGRALRGSGWFSLALWMSQRDEEAVAVRLADEKQKREEKKTNAKPERRAKGHAARPDGRTAAADSKRVSGGGSKPAETLGPATGAVPSSVDAQRGRKRVGDEHRKVVPTGRPVQISLFGD